MTITVDLDKGGFQAIGCMIAIIGLLGLTTNLVVLIVFFKKRSLINPTNVFIISLTWSNLAVSIFGNPFSASSNIAERWLYGDAGCVWYGFANTFFGLVSISTLTSIAIHRYLIVCKNDKGTAITVKIAVIWSVLGWIYGFFWAILPVLGWADYTYEGLGTWCSIDWKNHEPSSVAYIAIMFFFCFVLPITIMVIMYSNIFMMVHTITKNTLHKDMRQISLKRERRLIKMSFTIWMTFIIAWTPYAVTSLISVFGHNELLACFVGIWGPVISAVFAKTATIYNPIVYVGMNETFKVAFIEVFPCMDRFIKANDIIDTSTASDVNNHQMTHSKGPVSTHIQKINPAT